MSGMTKPLKEQKLALGIAALVPGSFCSRQGARGVSKTGKPMVCTTTAADPKKRWRAA